MSDIDLTDPKQRAAWEDGWELAHEPARCGHARANYKDPNYGTADYRGEEKCEFCSGVERGREAMDVLACAGEIKSTRRRGVFILAWLEDEEWAAKDFKDWQSKQ